jgi:hypothetical protein
VETIPTEYGIEHVPEKIDGVELLAAYERGEIYIDPKGFNSICHISDYEFFLQRYSLR